MLELITAPAMIVAYLGSCILGILAAIYLIFGPPIWVAEKTKTNDAWPLWLFVWVFCLSLPWIGVLYYLAVY